MRFLQGKADTRFCRVLWGTKSGYAPVEMTILSRIQGLSGEIIDSRIEMDDKNRVTGKYFQVCH